MADAKQGKTPMEDFYNGSSQSRVVLAKPRLGGFGSSNFASSSSKSCNPFGSVLRPSQLKPGNNPFLKVTEPEGEADEKEKKTEKEAESEDRLKEAKEEADTPKFVPLGSTNVTPRTTNPVPAPAQPAASSSSGFVFGQNLSERVVMQENVNNGDTIAVDHSSTNGTSDGKSELLFTSAAASVKENNQEEAGPSEGAARGSGGEGLAAAAAEYERSHARPPPPSAAVSITGEEDEVNVLQISCRLFAWESGSWHERGRGVLRLNDRAAGAGAAGGVGGAGAGGAAGGGGGSRLVARVVGSLRVVLNTHLWPDMVVERAGTKSLRITAADHHQQIKVFLIMGAPGDIVQLYRALTARVAMSKRTNNSAQNVSSQQAAERLEASADVDEFLAKDDDNDDDDDHQDDEPPHELEDDAAPSDRLDSDHKTEENISPTKDESKPLKRKEPAEEEHSSKRQCPEIVIE